MADGQEMLAHNMQARIRQQMMDVGNAAHQRIFHRDDAKIAIAVAHRFDRILEAGLGHRQGMLYRLARRQIGIGARLALEGDAFGVLDDIHVLRSRLARSRSAEVSTESGTLSTRATAMVICASRARNCSSFSRLSRAEGGRATKCVSAARVKA